MSDYCTIQDRQEFEGKIIDQVQGYLDLKDGFVNSIGLSIDGNTLEVNLCTKEECDQQEDWYPIEKLIRTENEEQQPDGDAIYDLASTYCFIG